MEVEMMAKETVIKILKKAGFTNEFMNYIDHKFPVDYQMIEDEVYQFDYEENPLLDLSAEEAMLESLAQLIHLKRAYLNKGIPLIHLYESIYDLSFRIERHYKRQGTYGLSDRDIRWLTPLYQMRLFDLGSLRFEIAHFSYKEIERSGHQYMPLSTKWKKEIPEGAPIITIHILKGTDFRPKKIKESFRQAVAFFGKYFPEHQFELFVCRTWLLYEPIQELLGENSNIASFARRFEIIAQNENTKQALERIYGTSNLDKIKQMDKSSSLQRIAYKNLDKVGEAAGIIHKDEIQK